MSLFTTKHERFSLTSNSLQQLFFRKLLIYFIRDVASVCSVARIVFNSLLQDFLCKGYKFEDIYSPIRFCQMRKRHLGIASRHSVKADNDIAKPLNSRQVITRTDTPHGCTSLSIAITRVTKRSRGSVSRCSLAVGVSDRLFSSDQCRACFITDFAASCRWHHAANCGKLPRHRE